MRTCIFLALVGVALGMKEPYQEEPCLSNGGTCVETACCPSNNYVSGQCPTQSDGIKCCYSTPTCPYNESPCQDNGGVCEYDYCCDNYQSGECPSQAGNIKCCYSTPTCSGSGYVPEACLECICFVESNCCMLSGGPTGLEHCVYDVTSYSCGPYQIKEDYWIDAQMYGGSLMGDWRTCTADWGCSEDCVNGYMQRYATEARLGTTPTCEHFSRIHNGGPNGHENPNTVAYWEKVLDCLNQGSCCEPYPPTWC